MRIRSNFKDYYDCIQRLGQDQELIFNRFSSIVELERTACPYIGNGPGYHDGDMYCDSIAIGFCGKVYIAVRMKKSYYDNGIWCHSANAVDAFIANNYNKKEQNYYFGRKPLRNRRQQLWHGHTQRSIKNFFKDNPPKQTDKKFIEHSCAIYCETGWTPAYIGGPVGEPRTPGRRAHLSYLTINPQLKRFNFAKVLDPYTAYQELQMYVANMAMPNKPIPEISDKDMLEIKGFDPKWSFRKEPTKKKRK